jgi:hypothetical protein
MNIISPSKQTKTKTVIRKCHCCGQVTETQSEIQKCVSCGKSFLPVNYFDKIHGDKEYKFDELFDKANEMEEEALIKGLFVIW